MASRRRPGTGETRKTNQPLKIDRLPPAVHEAICALRNQAGKTWQEIEDLSGEPFGKGQLGFVDWVNLPTPVLELFPDMRLPHTNLQRWYDIRVEQVQADVIRSATKAREIARAFAKSVVAGDDEAVINAARDTLMGVLAEDGSPVGRGNVAKGLIKLGELMQKAKTNRIRERKVAVDEQTLQMKLDTIKQKAGELLAAVAGETPGAEPLSREEVLNRVKDIYGVA